MGALRALPPELLVGWSLWVVGGLLLMLWFVRRSASPRTRAVNPHRPDARGQRLSGSHPVAARPRSGSHSAVRPLSGTHAVTIRPQSSAPGSDPFTELRALLDPPDKPPQPR